MIQELSLPNFQKKRGCKFKSLFAICISHEHLKQQKPSAYHEEKFQFQDNRASREAVKQIDLASKSHESIKEQLEPTEVQNPGPSGCGLLILNANALNCKDKKQALALRLIQKMNDEKNNEEKYIEYFKQLLSYEYFRGEKTSFEIDELENEIFDLHNSSLKVSSNYSKSKNSKTKTVSNTDKSKNQISASKEDYKKSENLSYNNKSKLVHQNRDRNCIRNEIIDKLLSCNKKDAHYDSLINELIDQVESFCNNS